MDSPSYLSQLTNVNVWKQSFHDCPPAVIYLVLGLVSIVLSIIYGKVGLVGFLVYAFVVAVVYYFFRFLCVDARWLAWILILIQLFVLGYTLFAGDDNLVTYKLQIAD
jgi:hypothetical protein